MIGFDNIDNIYFLGIGGIGMSALARYFNVMGKKVYGYDRTLSTLTTELQNEGIGVCYDDNTDAIPVECIENPEKTMVVFTPAVPKDNNIFGFFVQRKYLMLKRARVLGMIADNYCTIAVAGTHGKTTTSSIMSNILTESGKDNFAFLGGISKNLGSNFRLPQKKENIANPKTLLVAEADEFDRSFLWLKPYVSIITYVDADHLDIYKDRNDVIETFNKFAVLGDKEGFVIVNKPIEKLIDTHDIKKLTYSATDSSADFYARNIKIVNGCYVCDAVTPNGVIENITLGAHGWVNVENSMACVAASCCVGIKHSFIKKGLETFCGVKRRLDFHVQSSNFVYIDDYAHHPREIEATVTSVRKMFPDKKITGIFQPHLYTRTRDFAEGFAKSLSLLDSVILMDIYPAREKPIEGVNSQMLARLMYDKDVKIINNPTDIINTVKNSDTEVLLTLGAGNIDKLIEPLTKNFVNWRR